MQGMTEVKSDFKFGSAHYMGCISFINPVYETIVW